MNRIDTLLRSGASITVLLEAQSSAGMHYLSNIGYVTGINDATAPNRSYPDWLVGVPEIRESLPDGLFGRSNIGWSEAEISNPKGVRDGWLDEAWDGRPARLLVGASHWPLADFVPVFTGISTGLQALRGGGLRLLLADPREALNKPVQETLLGTGPTPNEVAPLTCGQVFNVPPVVIDEPLHRYVLHDGPLLAVSDVRVGGLTSAHTFDLAAGRFDMNVMPAGRVTADATGPGSSCADLLRLVATRAGVATFDEAALAALDIAAPQALGLWIGENRNAVDVLDEIAASVGAWWGFTGNNEFTAAVAGIGASVLTLTPDDFAAQSLELEDMRLPAWRVRLGYRRNWAVQADGLFGAVTEADRQRYGREYDVAEASDEAVKVLHPMARDPEIVGTLLQDAVQAHVEAARRLALFGVQRRSWVARVTRRGWQLRVGQTVRVFYPRFGLQAGADLLVTSVSRRIDRRSTEVTLWG